MKKIPCWAATVAWPSLSWCIEKRTMDFLGIIYHGLCGEKSTGSFGAKFGILIESTVEKTMHKAKDNQSAALSKCKHMKVH